MLPTKVKIIIIAVLIYFLTMFVIILSPETQKSVQITNTNNLFSNKDINKKNIELKGENKTNIIPKDIEISAKNKDITYQDIHLKTQPKITNNEQYQNINDTPKILTEEEELIAWNQWHAAVATESLRRLNLADIDKLIKPYTLITYSFNVDNTGKISDITIDTVIPSSEYSIVESTFIPVLEAYSYDSTLKFPNGTKRTTNRFTCFIISHFEGRKKASPDEFNDYELIKKYFYQ